MLLNPSGIAVTDSRVDEIEETANEAAGEKPIVIGNRTFVLGQSTEKDAELQALSKLIDQETGHGQWKKQAIVWFMITCVIFMNLCLGSAHFDSIVGISDCSFMYWGIQGIFVVICIIMTYVSININRAEQNLKIKYNVNFERNDVQF